MSLLTKVFEEACGRGKEEPTVQHACKGPTIVKWKGRGEVKDYIRKKFDKPSQKP
jgi:hypothetical protein